MRSQLGALMLLAAAAVGCASTTVSSSGGQVSAVRPANARRLPAGSVLQATFDQPIGTKQSHSGDQFTATVSEPVTAQDGETVIAAGTRIFGHVTGVHSGNVLGEQSFIRLDFDSLAAASRRVPFDAAV